MEVSVAGSLVGAMWRSFAGEGLFLIKRTYQPSKLRRNRKVGFLGRLGTKSGRDTIARRIAKGRHKVSVAFEAAVLEGCAWVRDVVRGHQ